MNTIRGLARLLLFIAVGFLAVDIARYINAGPAGTVGLIVLLTMVCLYLGMAITSVTQGD